MAENDDGAIIHSLATYQIGELTDGYLALLLAYGTSQEKLSKGEMESFVIGMDRDLAIELGEALVRRAKKPPQGGSPTEYQ